MVSIKAPVFDCLVACAMSSLSLFCFHVWKRFHTSRGFLGASAFFANYMNYWILSAWFAQLALSCSTWCELNRNIAKLRSMGEATVQPLYQEYSKQKLNRNFWWPWEIDPQRLSVGRRLAVGGFAEVFVGKYAVSWSR